MVATMASMWAELLGPNFQEALDLLEAAVQDCTDGLWQRNMWEVPDHDEVRGPDGDLITDPAVRRALVQRYAQPWLLSCHAREVLDANLNGGFATWEPWSGFGGKGIDDTTTLVTPWSQDELVAYTGYCRQRVGDTLAKLTDERAMTPIGRRGQRYAARLIGKLGHVIEHGSQIRQFITADGIAPATREKVGAETRIRAATAPSVACTQGTA